MDVNDVLLVVLAAALAAMWWRRCSKTGGVDGLPPGPPGWPVVGNLFQVILQRRPFMYVVRDLREKYGPIFTMRMGQRTLIVVTSAELIHEALVKQGPMFASRPEDSPTRLLFSVGKCTVNSAPYGPLWRALRRNFVAEIVSPHRVKGFSWIREWAVDAHLRRLCAELAADGAVRVMASCRLTICSILICICFGAKIPDELIREIEEVLKDVMMMTMPKLPDFLPLLTPLFRKQLTEARALRRRQLNCLVPLVRARRDFLRDGTAAAADGVEMMSGPGEAYVDSLFDLEPPGRGKRLGEEELVTLCSEVMSAGTDTSATALEWAMMHLVLDPAAQERLYDEVVAKAVVKETFRRHPPSHFVLSHAATRDTELGGYRVPADASVEFYTAWVTENPATWPDPDAWRPERFLEGGEGFDTDITGTRALRMMPFGAGRRICPAATLGVLHIQLMLANMVREFRWLPPAGEGPPDPTETFAFTVVMKNPLRAAFVERATTETATTA
ncbi:Cytochrome P450 77A3 [Zea mays]|uniref:Cytochrome P450 77A3 n=1 Tax=Zea mays TaxID=4577 RepID=A0A3L6ETQ0_MAIZE|nr:Cytochrome P450 77A3 [Zea mays]